MEVEKILSRVPINQLLRLLPEWQAPYFSNGILEIDENEIREYISSVKFEIFRKTDKLSKIISYCNINETRDIANLCSELYVFRNNIQSLTRQIMLGKISKKSIELIREYFEVVDNNDSSVLTEKKCSLSNGKRFYELLDYQMYIKEQLLSLVNLNYPLTRVLVHMPTGTGKTKTTMHLINQYYQDYMEKPGLIIWIAHTNILLEQAEETLENVWESLGFGDLPIYRIYSGIELNIDEAINSGGIVFSNISSLINLLKKDNLKFDLLSSRTKIIVFDEAHKILASETRRVINELMKKKANFLNRILIGLSATPGRSVYDNDENLKLADFFEKRIINIDIKKIDQFSKDSVVFANQENDDKKIIKYFQKREILSVLIREVLNYKISEDFKVKIDTFKKRRESLSLDYDIEIVNLFAINVERNRVIIEKLIKLANDSIPTIFFACSVEHGKFITAILKSKKINASEVYGETGDVKRTKEIEKFKNGVNKILVNCSVLTTGFDSTNIKCVFIAKPTKSIVLYSQMIGRGLRGPKMGGNKECLLIDIKDNLDRFSNEDEAFSYFEEFWRQK